VISTEAAHERLTAFLPSASEYAAQRNYDRGPGQHDAVSRLSPFLTTRLISEQEVVERTLAEYPYRAVEKFIQEVCWRTYWKGWLEMRPSTWTHYIEELERTDTIRRLPDYQRAVACETGIACYDLWVKELIETGYLHNHARMWFASIWIFTLRLPWALGAAFFLEHLLDGDAASNTLSWRWVAGLQTRGKCYIASAANIAKFTEGRFPDTPGLAQQPEPIDEEWEPTCEPLSLPSPLSPPDAGERVGLLLHPDDISHQSRLGWQPAAVAGWLPESHHRGETPRRFRHEALASKTTQLLANPDSLREWMAQEKLDRLVVPFTTVGPVADTLRPALASLRVDWSLREWDRALWPFATKGYFHFKKQMEPWIRTQIPGKSLER